MEYYQEKSNVLNYLSMVQEKGNELLINQLKRFLPRDQTVLELGMGSGYDLDMLKSWYRVTGSDYSPWFLEEYRKRDTETELIDLDIQTFDLDRSFDAIYSNKVLIHFSPEELPIIFKKMVEHMNPNGLVLHSFWKGDGEERMDGFVSYYYTKKLIRSLMDPYFKILEIDDYKEEKEGDSFFVLGRRK